MLRRRVRLLLPVQLHVQMRGLLLPMTCPWRYIALTRVNRPGEGSVISP